ncbi:MAG: TetR/AcrR family transcriptional regulator [Xanthomonadales bacterium]|nr:TetR/AcrR family transcriptional regulator [Xanthomonadales bacterium]
MYSKQQDKIRLSAVDWQDAALEALAERGVQGVAVEPLARKLGVTKGSFYWHYPNRDALLVATLERWENQECRAFEEDFFGVEHPRERMCEMFRRTQREVQSHVIFCALFKAVDLPVVGVVMQRVSEHRTDLLSRGFRDLGLDTDEALKRARLAYLSYVGFLQYYQSFKAARMVPAELADYIEHVIQTLIP